MKDMKKFSFECDCSSDQHAIKVAFDLENREVFLTTFLPHHHFFGRLLHAVKYLFGYTSKYGHFEETILSYEKAVELGNLFTEFKVIAANDSKVKIKQALDDIDSGKPNSAYKSIKPGASRKDLLPSMGKKNGTTKV